MARAAVIAPPYFALEIDELVQHFAAAAAARHPLPFYLCEYADRSGYVVPVSVIERLRDRAPNLAGMKVSDAPLERVEPYLATGLDVFIGAEAVLAEGLEHGAVGAVSGVAGAFPEAVSALVRDPAPERVALVASLRRRAVRPAVPGFREGGARISWPAGTSGRAGAAPAAAGRAGCRPSSSVCSAPICPRARSVRRSMLEALIDPGAARESA